MNYKIHKAGEEPAYLQLYHYFVADIIAGVYPYGAKLPSKRVISEETELSLVTVEHTLELLSDEGYIEPRMRSGYFVIYRAADFQGNWEPETIHYRDEVMISHSPGEFPFSVMAKTMRKVLLDYKESILTKSDNAGCMELRHEICSYLARSRSINVTPQQIIIGSGAEYLYGLIAQYFGTGSVIAIENPSYEKIEKVYESMGCECKKMHLYKDGIRIADLKSAGADVLHVTPFNSFPSGVSISISKKLEYLKWADINNSIIIEDNYDSELTVSSKPEDSLFSLSAGGNVIYINTFSRTISSAVRMGYMVIPKELIDTFEEKLGFYSCTVPLFEQYVVCELLRNGDFERHVNRIRRAKRKTEMQ